MVTQVDEECVLGSIGHAKVMIPRFRMNDFKYDQAENVFWAYNTYGDKVKTEVEEMVRCRVVEWICESTFLFI
jgi:DNA-directed RNA polymerase subunit E'/Rpb7